MWNQPRKNKLPWTLLFVTSAQFANCTWMPGFSSAREKLREKMSWLTDPEQRDSGVTRHKETCDLKSLCVSPQGLQARGWAQFLNYTHPFYRGKHQPLVCTQAFLTNSSSCWEAFFFFLFKNLLAVTAAHSIGVISALRCRFCGLLLLADGISKETSFAGYSVLHGDLGS